jgi:hypothetical protein
LAKHRIFRHTSESLATLLEDGVKDVVGRSILVVTGPPLREKFTRMPALGVYLYRVGFRKKLREESATEFHRIDAKGTITKWHQDPSVLMDLDYLVTAWADEDAEQQELLGAAMRVLLANPVMEGDSLEGDAFDPDTRIPIRPVEELSVEFLMSLWRGFGEHLRPAMGYTCRVRLESPRRTGLARRIDDANVGVKWAPDKRRPEEATG